MSYRETDQELVQKALQGDQKAYARLLTRYRDNIFYYILRMVGGKTDANDLTIETFDKAFRKIETYSDTYAFSTWLYKIAQNTTIDFLRKRKANILHIDYGGGDEEDLGVNENTLQSSILDPEESMIRQQEEILVKTQIELMKPKYRRLIELRYIKEYAYEEIATELGLPLGTVKTQLFRAKNLLAELLLKRMKNHDY